MESLRQLSSAHSKPSPKLLVNLVEAKSHTLCFFHRRGEKFSCDLIDTDIHRDIDTL